MAKKEYSDPDKIIKMGTIGSTVFGTMGAIEVCKIVKGRIDRKKDNSCSSQMLYLLSKEEDSSLTKDERETLSDLKTQIAVSKVKEQKSIGSAISSLTASALIGTLAYNVNKYTHIKTVLINDVHYDKETGDKIKSQIDEGKGLSLMFTNDDDMEFGL